MPDDDVTIILDWVAKLETRLEELEAHFKTPEWKAIFEAPPLAIAAPVAKKPAKQPRPEPTSTVAENPIVQALVGFLPYYMQQPALNWLHKYRLRTTPLLASIAGATVVGVLMGYIPIPYQLRTNLEYATSLWRAPAQPIPYQPQQAQTLLPQPQPLQPLPLPTPALPPVTPATP